MNILYINHYAGSLDMGMEFRPFYLAREWQKMGHKVRIVAATFSHLRKKNPSAKRDFEIQIIDGIEYQWIKTGEYEGNGVARAKTMFEFCGKLSLAAGRLARDFAPDAVISSSTYPMDTWPAQSIAKRAGAVYVHEAHDLWPLTLIELAGWSPAHPFIRLLAAAEHSALSRSDAIVAVTAGEADYMLEHGMQSREKFTHIPNGVVLADWEAAEALDSAHLDAIKALREEGKFLICYLGGHALSNALDTLLDAAKRMKRDPGFAFLLVGSGAEKPRLEARAKEEALDNVLFLPPVGKKQVPSLLREMDALYVGAAPCGLYRYGVSMNKVYDYMMAGKPILYGVEAKNNDVAEAGCGLTIPPGDAAALCSAAATLRSMSPAEREAMGSRGRSWVAENCDVSALAARFLDVMIGEREKRDAKHLR